MKSYDAVIIGAGIAGLTAASLIARRGLSVAVLEQSDRPGGSCSAFRRDGVTHDTGAAMLFGFGEKGFNPHRYVMEELGQDLEVYRHEALYRLNYGDKGVVFWPEYGRFFDELERIVPGARPELESFYGEIRRLHDEVINRVAVFTAPTEMLIRDAQARFLKAPIAHIRMLALLGSSAADLARRHIRDRRLLTFFDKLTSTYCYTTMVETPAVLAATMFSENHEGGGFYPAGSTMVLASRLERAAELAGADFLYHADVRELLFDGARAVGVRLSDGREVHARALVYAGAVKHLAGVMIGEAAIVAGGGRARRWIDRVRALVDSYPSFVVYGTVRRDAVPEGTLPVEMFIDNREVIDDNDVTLYLPTIEDPRLAPPGVHVFLIIGPSFAAWPTYATPGAAAAGGAGYRSAEYRDMKVAEADRMLALVERRFPGFVAAIKTRIEGSPTTLERYLRKFVGSVAGPKQCIGQELLRRPHARSPWPGLFIAGEATVMGTGTPAVTVSGISAANVVLRARRLPEYRSAAIVAEGGQARVRVIPAGRPGNLPASEAGRLAASCQWCEAPACVRACPTSIDMPAIMRRLEMDNPEGALKRLKESDAGFPSCAACAPDATPPCEAVCVRKPSIEGAVKIRQILMALGA
ncbi:MAG: FAD-dependent oxidoreductase [Rectinemataceae bacterium]